MEYEIFTVTATALLVICGLFYDAASTPGYITKMVGRVVNDELKMSKTFL